jgi:hypothetical protein
MDSQWAEQRKRAISVHAAELARREAAEAEQARAMLLEFVSAVRGRAIASGPLQARSFDGRHRYRTKLRGWYLTDDRRFAVDEDGQFYILTVPASLRAMVSGAPVAPTRPRLVIGEGGRDGERIALRILLDHVLDR